MHEGGALVRWITIDSGLDDFFPAEKVSCLFQFLFFGELRVEKQQTKILFPPPGRSPLQNGLLLEVYLPFLLGIVLCETSRGVNIDTGKTFFFGEARQRVSTTTTQKQPDRGNPTTNNLRVPSVGAPPTPLEVERER